MYTINSRKVLTKFFYQFMRRILIDTCLNYLVLIGFAIGAEHNNNNNDLNLNVIKNEINFSRKNVNSTENHNLDRNFYNCTKVSKSHLLLLVGSLLL